MIDLIRCVFTFFLLFLCKSTWKIGFVPKQWFVCLTAEKYRNCVMPDFEKVTNTQDWGDTHRLHHIKTRNRKGYENHVITLYSVVTWFFFYKFCLIFREFKANLTVTWLKCVAFLGDPSLAGKMGKWEKWVRFFREIGTLYKIQKKNLCNMICFPKKEWYWIISLNMTDKRKRILTTRFSILNISKM